MVSYFIFGGEGGSWVTPGSAQGSLIRLNSEFDHSGWCWKSIFDVGDLSGIRGIQTHGCPLEKTIRRECFHAPGTKGVKMLFLLLRGFWVLGGHTQLRIYSWLHTWELLLVVLGGHMECQKSNKLSLN